MFGTMYEDQLRLQYVDLSFPSFDLIGSYLKTKMVSDKIGNMSVGILTLGISIPFCGKINYEKTDF